MNFAKQFVRVFIYPLIVIFLLVTPIICKIYSYRYARISQTWLRSGADYLRLRLEHGKTIDDAIEFMHEDYEYLSFYDSNRHLLGGSLPKGLSPEDLDVEESFYTQRINGKLHTIIIVKTNGYLYVSIIPFFYAYQDCFIFVFVFLIVGLLCISISLLLFRDRLAPKMRQYVHSTERMQTELDIAHGLQQQLVPLGGKQCIGEHIVTDAILLPAREIGGDLYDYDLVGNRLYFCIGDVSDKGAPSAIMMAILGTLFHRIAEFNEPLTRISSALNNALFKDNTNCMFCTFFMGYIDLENSELHFVNAGHNPPLLNGEPIKVIPNLPLGVMPDFVYQEQCLPLCSGDQLFLYTDGVTEAINTEKEFYGEKRLCETVQNNADITAVLRSIELFRGAEEQNDDITMLTIKYI